MGKGWGRRRFLIAALVAALVVAPAVLVLTQQRAASAATILSILDGTASVARGTAAFVVAADGDIVNVGDRVQTADRSHAIVTFFDGSTLELDPATTVQIEAASSAGSGAIDIRIAQTLGRTWASVQKLTRADSKFELRSPTLTAAVRGTGFITEVLADGSTTVRTTDGSVAVTAQGQTVLVGAGQSTSAQSNAPPAVPTATLASNRLRFGMHSPAYLVVVDPFGRACGIVLPGPTLVRQIPGCLASDPGTDPQLVDVPDAAVGTYQIIVASIAPGGAFVATASALDPAGSLSFNYAANGSGQPGDKFASRIDVSAGARGALAANGLGPLSLVERAPVKLVVSSSTPRPIASGTPDASLFSPLPGIGFAVGPATTITPLSTAAPTLTTVPAVSVTPLPTVAVPTAAVGAPTLPPTELPTVAPTVIPTLPPTPTLALTPTPQPTPTPTPPPTPTPLPPTLSGGSAAPGANLAVLGTDWPAGAAVVIKWPDGTQIGGADAQADGRFATLLRIPQNAVPGQTYRITASGGGQVATADVTIAIVYTPSFTLLNSFPPRAGGSVAYTGRGWPESRTYAIQFDGVALTGSGGTTSATGDFQGSFTVPPNTAPGQHTVTATSAGYSVNAPLLTQ